MIISLLFMFVADPGLQQVHVEGRSQATHIDLSFSGRPTFQAFQSQAEGLLVVDVVGGKRPAGFPERIPLHGDAHLRLVEHVGSRTRLLRLELHTAKGVSSSARALRGGIRLEVRQGSKGLRVFQASGSRLVEPPSSKVEAPRSPPVDDSNVKGLELALKKERQETNRLRQLIGSFRRHSGERTAELRSLDENLSERRAQSKRRKAELKAAGKSLSEVEKKIRLRRQEIVKLQAAEADAKRRLDQVKGSSKDRGAELNRLELVELAHRAEITRLVREEMDLEQGDTAYLARMAKLQLSVKSLAKKQKKLTAKAAKRANVLKSREQEAEGLKAEQARYRRRIKELDQRHAKIDKGVQAKDKELEQLRGKLDVLDRELGVAIARYEKAQKGLGKAQNEEADFENRAVALRARIAKLVRDTADREAQHGQANRRLGKQRARIKKLTASVASARNDAQRAGVQLARARKAVASTEQRAAALSQEFARLEALSSKAKGRLSEFETKLAAQRKVVQALRERLAKQQAGLSKVAPGAKAAKVNLAKLKREKQRLKAALKATQKRIDNRQKNVAVTRRDLVKTKAEVGRLNADLASLKRRQSSQLDRTQELNPKRQLKRKTSVKKTRKERLHSNGFGGAQGAITSERVAKHKVEGAKKSDRQTLVKRVGYRPVGPERVVIHVQGKPKAKLKQISETTTLLEIRGARSVKTNGSLNTRRFGGRIHRISSRYKQGRVRVRITHESGLRLKSVHKKGRLEVRVR
ncbi:MAG TPA: hypothetical protein DEB46_06655 [Myxococcales bacterium]|nr:hypothetical protein [Myxococcales bacterium]